MFPEYTGVLNITTSRRSMYHHAMCRSQRTKSCSAKNKKAAKKIVPPKANTAIGFRKPIIISKLNESFKKTNKT
jgi:hypothetical protein